MDSYARELQLEFPVRLENPHIVKEDQVFVSVVKRGISKRQFNSSYRFRTTPEYLTELGRTIAAYTHIVSQTSRPFHCVDVYS